MKGLLDLIDIFMDFLGSSNNATTDLWNAFLGVTYKELFNAPVEAIMKTQASILTSLYSAVLPVGLMLMLIAFAAKVMEMGLDQRFSVDKFVKDFILFIIVLMFLDNGVNDSYSGWIQKSYEYVVEISDDLISTQKIDDTINNSPSKDAIDSVRDGAETTESSGGLISWITNFKEKVKEAFLSVLSSIIISVIFIIGYAIIILFVFGVGMYRAVKIGIYVVLAPIGIASCYSKGASGLVYFKKLFALFLQYPVILVTTYVALKAMSLETNPLIAFIAVGTIVAALVSSESKAKELLK